MENTLKFLITGGTGFIGTYLRSRLLKEGHYVTIITRNPKRYQEEHSTNQRFIHWDEDLSDELAESDVVINLAGQNLVGVRWTDKLKELIYTSRIDSTRQLVDAMKKAKKKPNLFISASAAGYYGDNGDKVVDESTPPGNDFLAKVCQDWESEALQAKELGIRVAIPRMGIPLQDDGGMVAKMKLPFQLFVGGPVGDGKQYIPWLHMDDLCRALIYPVEHERLEGPYNVNAPNPVTMNELAS
ncbi:MAG: TIGR01777 family oxidoreductase, partial [Balneolaceae bacterium]